MGDQTDHIQKAVSAKQTNSRDDHEIAGLIAAIAERNEPSEMSATTILDGYPEGAHMSSAVVGHRQAEVPIWIMALPVIVIFAFAILMMLEEAGAGEGPSLTSDRYSTALTTDMPLADLAADADLGALPVTLAGRTPRAGAISGPQSNDLRQSTTPLHDANSIPAAEVRPALTAPLIVASNVARQPSLKPTSIASGPERGQVSNRVIQSLPVRPIPDVAARGSASELANRLVAAKGVQLDRHQRTWLARDMERLLDEAPDGHIAELNTASGARLQVVLEESRDVRSDVPIVHTAAIETLPERMTLEGGWYIARQSVPFLQGPNEAVHLSHGLEKNMLIERMASYEGKNGARWYLMGHHGLALGFVSSADLARAEDGSVDLGVPFSAPVAEVQRSLRTVNTICRKGLIGAQNATVHAFDLCRNPLGNWVPFRESVD